MINNFTKKGFVQKIIIILIFLTIFNFLYPNIPTFAADDEEESIKGGVLLTPIIDLITALCEGVISLCQKNVLGMGESSIHVNSEDIGWGIGAAIGGAIGIIGGAAAVIAAPFTAQKNPKRI